MGCHLCNFVLKYWLSKVSHFQVPIVCPKLIQRKFAFIRHFPINLAHLNFRLFQLNLSYKILFYCRPKLDSQKYALYYIIVIHSNEMFVNTVQ